LIVDDSALARRAIRAVLAESNAFEVVGEAADAASGIARTRVLTPDLVLMDLRMPRLGGLEAIRVIKEEFPGTIVVVLSVSDDPQDFFEAIRCGAQGYLVKNVEPGLWLEYLEALVHGDARISRAIASRILHEFTQSTAAPADLPTLTRREEEILRLVAGSAQQRDRGLSRDRRGNGQAASAKHPREAPSAKPRRACDICRAAGTRAARCRPERSAGFVTAGQRSQTEHPGSPLRRLHGAPCRVLDRRARRRRRAHRRDLPRRVGS
jgi:DNA-binding NarL/FixJ family response regulator